MNAQVTISPWDPIVGSLPKTAVSDTVYVVPTKVSRDGHGTLLYSDNVRDLPKLARAKNVPVEFSGAGASRQYVTQFSIDPEVWQLALACLQITNAWLIATVEIFLAYREEDQGWSRKEARSLPLSVLVNETSTERKYEIQGSGTEVIEAIRELQKKPLGEEKE